jgi:FkbM family methyltransferase
MGVSKTFMRRWAVWGLAPLLGATRSVARKLARSAAVQRAFLDHLGERNVQLVIDAGDHAVQCFPGDSIGRSLFFRGAWQRDLLSFAIDCLSAKGALPPNAIFVDAGANIGTQSLYAYLSGKFAKVVSIEPDSRNFQVLQSNLARNGYPIDLAFNLGAGAAPSRLKLYRNAGSSGKHSFLRRSDESTEVGLESVENILRSASLALDEVGLVWIDVEGFEPQVLMGMASLLERSCPIVLEFTPAFYGIEGAREFVSLLATHYASYKVLEGGHGVEKPISSLLGVVDQIDILLGFG